MNIENKNTLFNWIFESESKSDLCSIFGGHNRTNPILNFLFLPVLLDDFEIR